MKLIAAVSILFVGGLFFVPPALGSGDVIGVLKSVEGSVKIHRNQEVIEVKAGDKLLVNDMIVTGRKGAMGAILRDNSILSIGPASRISINEFMFKPLDKKLSFVATVIKGTTTYMTGVIAKLNRKGVRFKTPNAVVGVRGTYVAVKVGL